MTLTMILALLLMLYNICAVQALPNEILNYDISGCKPNEGFENFHCVDEIHRVGFTITTIADDNASKYSISLAYDSTSTITNTEALLYVYRKPTIPHITGNTTVAENSSLTLWCYSDSTSLPPEFTNLSIMEYYWSGAYNGTGSNITTGQLSRKQDGSIITCTAKEQGTNDTLSISNSTVLNILYPPGNVILTTNSTSVIEGKEGLNLTCIILDDQHGNPDDMYSYFWKYPSLQHWTTSNRSILTIEYTLVNATIHDGEWQCKIGNVIGNSTTDNITLVVSAIPSVQQHPEDTTIVVSEPLFMSCSFSAKPAANIIWIYKQSDLPDANVINITNSEIYSYPYITTASTLSWKTPDEDKRKYVSGNYTCKSSNSLGNKMSQAANLDIQYWPWTISFISPGDTSDIADVIECTTIVKRTCSADCNPDCSYIWINNTNGVNISYTTLLDLDKPDRYDGGTYTCKAYNKYGEKNKTFTLIIRFSPSLSITTSNSSEIIEKDNVTFSCNVTSNPVSEIKLYNMTDNNTLYSWESVNKAEYQFFNVHCLDTSEYMFTVGNGIPDEHYIMKDTAYIDIMCAPRKSYQFPETEIQGLPLGDNYTLEVGIVSNPFPLVTTQSWSFVGYNGTLYDNLPDNVNVSVHFGVERLTILVKLIVTDAKSINYGNYCLVAGNNYGNMTPVTQSVVPEGPPMPPSAPRLMDITAVSIKINWTAGFNGGFEQRFTVLYKAAGNDIEHEAEINTDPDVNKGYVVAYTLNDYSTIQSNTTYSIRIKAENGFQETSVVYGEVAKFKTLVKAVFTKDPDIIILEGRADIHFIISGSLTHILEENCVKDTIVCDKTNITVPTNRHMKLSQDSDLHDFTVDVPLADLEATEFIFSFWMYDGEYMLYQDANTIPVDITGSNIGVIVGVVIAVILSIAVVVIFIILWKRGILLKMDSNKSNDINSETNTAEYNNPTMIPDGRLSDMNQGEVGSITGDTYSPVIRSGKQQEKIKPKTPINPCGAGKEFVYENIAMSVIGQGQQGDVAERQRQLPAPGVCSVFRMLVRLVASLA
ncbi:hypothetical protein LSH36_968g00018 [Paralvinella palmiformis]|uniref:Uncharacterized protein n=1 Tax=Paralvinella palmiformis TaxID=53620 RepID=A0AAD9IXC6_9ANNE|nr:hypothetical protein LSH36_968g00018 [Paralvinella palmiformis]